MKLSSLFTVGTGLFIIVIVRKSDAANIVQCGDTINETTKLNDHLECDCNNGPALVVMSAKLNMNKKNVSCQEGTHIKYEKNNGERLGVITLLGKKSKVSNGFVNSNNDQTSSGVVLGGVGKHQLSNVEAVGFEWGIVIDEASSKNTISKCLSKDSDFGFIVYDDSNTLEQNVATSNDRDGFYVEGNNNTLKKNEATSNVYGYGFKVYGGSNTLKKNVATSNEYGGFGVYGDSNTLKKNVATSNEYDGFYVFGNTNTLQQNVATSNNYEGFSVEGNTNTLKKNVATSNEYGGFYVVDSDGNTLEQNVAKYNEYDGFYVWGNTNTLQQNKAKENEKDGFYVDGNSNALKQNKATGNIDTGFVISNTSTGNTVKKNEAADNGLADYSVNCAANTFVENKGNDPCSVG